MRAIEHCITTKVVINKSYLITSMLRRDLQLRRQKSNQFYQHYSDEVITVDYQTLNNQELIKQVLDFFFTESQCIYPAKYIFCNIIYAYYLQKYFNLEFYQSLDDKDTLIDSPIYCLYSDKKCVYDQVIKVVYNQIDLLSSCKKTRLYFKQEFLIFDEDFREIL